MAQTLDFFVFRSWGYTPERFIYTLPPEAAQVSVQIGTLHIAGGMRGVHYNWHRLQPGKCTTSTPLHPFPPSLENLYRHVNSHCLALQHLLQTVLLVLAALISGSILTALQFPAVLSSPVAALLFAIVTTFSLGTIAAITGGELAPLPMYALFLVSESMWLQ